MKLTDSLARSVVSPSWETPSISDLKKVKVGDYVKLRFEFDEGTEPFPGERLWVEVVEIDADDLRGTIANNPLASCLEFGQEVTFSYSNVCATM